MKVLVTGGGGFLGGAIVRQLLARGDEVTSVSRSRYPELERLGVRCIACDLADAPTTMAAFEGQDLVFHVAAKAGVWGPRAEYERANVSATVNVLDACRAHGINRLVYTSSPSVCFDGSDHLDADNSLPRATEFLAHYPDSKARAEKLVLDANSAELATCALRPHLIFGPGDPHILPRLIDRARKGRLVIVGDGSNEVTLTYVENAAHAHLCAANSLSPAAPHAGKAYFIGQEEPVRLWTWIGDLLGELGLPPVKRRLSESAARRVGSVLETMWRLGHLPGEPPMTRFLASQLARSHSYTMEPAKRDFGYSIVVSMPDAVAATVDAFR